MLTGRSVVPIAGIAASITEPQNASQEQSRVQAVLTLGEMLGRYPTSAGYARLEYQIGSRLIWVMCCSGKSEWLCEARAERMLAAAYDSLSAAIALAEQYSRTQLPELWDAHDRSGIGIQRLDVWGVQLTPDDNTISYEISRNHEFDFEERPVSLPELPDPYFIRVDRSPDGALQVRL